MNKKNEKEIKNLVSKHKLLKNDELKNKIDPDNCPVIKLKKNQTYEYDCPKCDASSGFGGFLPVPKKVINMTCDSCGYEGDSTDFKLIKRTVV